MDIKLTINYQPDYEDLDHGEVQINKKATFDEVPLAFALEQIKEAFFEADKKLEITVKVK